MAGSGDIEQREILYRGMVQGVGFRYTTRRLAARFRVTGYVKNLPDGRVLVVVEGAAGELQRFLQAVAREMAHYIDEQQETVRPATGGFDGFEIRY